MELRQGLRRAKELDVDAIRQQAEEAGFATFVLPADGIVDRSTFFDAVRTTFPLDPPLVGSRSWDALSDSLWQDLCTHPARFIAILWPNATTMARSAAADFETALSVLADVVNLLADPVATCDNRKEVAVLVEGTP